MRVTGWSGRSVAALAALTVVAGCGSATSGNDASTTAARNAASSSSPQHVPDWETVARLRLSSVPEELELRSSPRGGGVVSWDEYDRDPATTASVTVQPDGSLGTVTRKPISDGSQRSPGSVAPPVRRPGVSSYASGKDGKGVVAFAPTARDGGGLPDGDREVRAWRTVTRNGQTTYGRAIELGPIKEMTELSAAVLPSGDATVIWGTQDAGEQADEPWRVRVATVRGERVTRQVLDPGSVDRPTGAPAIVARPDGRLVAVWSSVEGYDDRRIVAAVSDTRGVFNDDRQRLDGGGSGNQIAVGPDGTVLATWSAGSVESAILSPGATRFRKEFRTGPLSEPYAAPGFTGRGEPLLVAEDGGELVVRVRR